MHPGDLAPSPVHVGRARRRSPVGGVLAGPFDAGADLIVNGHDHDYERFAPQTPTGVADPGRGIREIVVGTGGESLRLFKKAVANSEVRNASTYGVLRLDLAPGSYAWHFMGVSAKSFSDNGSATCH